MLAPISRPTTVPDETDEDEGLKHFEQVSCYAFNINFSLETVWLSLSLTNHYKVSFYSLRRKLFCDCSKTLFPMKQKFSWMWHVIFKIKSLLCLVLWSEDDIEQRDTATVRLPKVGRVRKRELARTDRKRAQSFKKWIYFVSCLSTCIKRWVMDVYRVEVFTVDCWLDGNDTLFHERWKKWVSFDCTH